MKNRGFQIKNSSNNAASDRTMQSIGRHDGWRERFGFKILKFCVGNQRRAVTNYRVQLGVRLATLLKMFALIAKS